MLKKSSRSDLESRDAKRLKKSKSDSESSESDSESSDSESSSSSSSESSDNESKTIDSKIKKLNRLLQDLSSELESAHHKYGKIERALAKTSNQDDKLKKIKKYKMKYKYKIDKLKKRIDMVKNKLAILNKDKNETIKKPTVKVPYPVLNDKRDMKLILGTLEKKFKELGQKKEANLKTLAQCDKTSSNFQKLFQLDQMLDAQRDKLAKQIEFLKLSLSLEAINRQPNQDPMMRQKTAKLTAKINELFNFMKNENKMSQDGVDSPVKKQDLFEQKLNELYEQLNKALVAYLAHTAATAHTAAAISAVNYNYYSYYQNSLETSKPVVELKTELENASSKFGKLKEKISSFLTMSKITEKKDKPKLIADYSGSEESDNEVIEEKKQQEEEESEDEDDLEIVMTSDLKSQTNERNYLLPSLKASYFPLKASIMNEMDEKEEDEEVKNDLIAVEQSKFSLTFLANASTITNSNNFLSSKLNRRTNVKLADILYSN